jgi:hypothetical protein
MQLPVFMEKAYDIQQLGNIRLIYLRQVEDCTGKLAGCKETVTS